ncbi:MAG TPA: lysophospholipid acyltransferase family protein [Gemmatimonadales bacterium]
MEGLITTLVSIWTWTVLGGTLLIWLPILALMRLVLGPFDRGRYWTGLFFRQVAVITSTLNPYWRFRIAGVKVADPRRPYVVVSNHESFADILLISHLPWEMKWLSKVELMRIPVIGWDMYLAGDIPVERGTARSAVKAMQRCQEVLKKKVSVVIFPEGTRSATGEMLPFKDGAFRLAIDAGVPILPLVVSGTSTALRKHDWRVGKVNAVVKVLDPIETTGLTHKDIKHLRDRVRALIEAERGKVSAKAIPVPAQPET